MCGITGFCTFENKIKSKEFDIIIRKMSNSLSHRGPNDEGIWIDSNHGIAMGHKRLSILDLSKSGHQPMISKNGRYIISYNGEIYNFKSLKVYLKKLGYSFVGNSDTEVMLCAFQEWGIIKSLKKFDGMFAFVVWDRKNNQIWLARDKIGEKPLYYGFQNNKFFFGSELKSIIVNPYFKKEINKVALNYFLKYSYVPSPISIFKGINKLPPGHFIAIKNSTKFLNSKPYWDLLKLTKSSKEELFEGSENEAIDELDKILLKNVESRMISDVPIGAFLSSGIDSSLITSIMQSVSKKPINTFTIGFENQKFNEAIKAKKIAKYLGTNHTELYVNDKDALDIIPDLSRIYDEPFGDSSQIPTNLLASLAKKNVSVALSGDGGDELFGGYNRYFMSKKYFPLLNLLPHNFKRLISNLIKSTSPNIMFNIENFINFIYKNKSNIQISSKFYKLGKILNSNDIESIYYELICVMRDSEKYLTFYTEPMKQNFDWSLFSDTTISMQYLDLMNYHPDDILVKIDRAAMKSSLETRIPFLSPEVIKFSIKLPRNYLYRNNQGKWILRKVLNRYIPKEISEGPKIGFGVPLNEWLRGPLFEWGKDLISNSKLNDHGYFNIDKINEVWNLHQTKKANCGMEIWNILTFQSWYEKWIKKL